MPNQIMRTGGKDKDNIARGFLTDEQGRMETTNTLKRVFLEKTEVLTYEQVFRSTLKKSEGYLSSRLSLSLTSNNRSLKVTIIDLEQLTPRTPRVIYDGSPNSHHLNIDFELISDEYYIEVEATHSGGLGIQGRTSYEVLHNNVLKSTVDNVMRTGGKDKDNITREFLTDELGRIKTSSNTLKRAFSTATEVLEYEQVFRSELKKSEGYLSSRLRLSLGSDKRKFKVTIIDLEQLTPRTPRVVFDGYSNGYHVNIDFELMSDEYYIDVEVTDPYGLGIQGTRSYEILHNNVLNLDIEKTMLELKDDVGKKAPTKPLKFKQSPLDIQVANKGYDDYFYVVDNSGTIKKYEDIKTNGEPLETGINIWDSLGFTAQINYVFVMREGITYFINEGTSNSAEQRGVIYHAETINDTPTQVYKATSTSFWSRHFGVKEYDNGIDSVIFCGLYGGSADNGLDLLLSLDGGTTFSKVGETRNRIGTTNHWHDVAIDTYSGYLFTSQGDTRESSSVHYSKDFGETWEVLTENMQPTAIVPFPDRVVFGRDDFKVGLDYVMKPENPSHNFKEPKELTVFNNQQASYFFARAGISEGNEAYMTFSIYGIAKNPIIVATGDFGKSWHGVFYSKNNVGNFFHMDDKFVYGYNKEYDGVIYSEKPEWQ